MKSVIIFVILILFLCSCASTKAAKDLQKASAHYQLGTSYLNDNNIQPAFVEFQKALEYNPDGKEIHNAIGIIYLTKLEDYSNAITHFKEALKLDSNFSEAANNLGSSYARMKKYNDAIYYFKMAASNPLYRNASMALYNLGMVYYRIAKYDDAIDSFKESLKRFSTFYLPYYGLALCYNAKGLYGEAATSITHAIEFDPLYKGDRAWAIRDLNNKRLKTKGEEEKDIVDYLEILKY